MIMLAKVLKSAYTIFIRENFIDLFIEPILFGKCTL